MTLIVVLAAFLLILGSILVLREVIEAGRAETPYGNARDADPPFSEHAQRRVA